jgi:vancomycin resistance protein YoaR
MKKGRAIILSAFAAAVMSVCAGSYEARAEGTGSIVEVPSDQAVDSTETQDFSVSEATTEHYDNVTDDTILPNVYINGISVSGKSRMQAVTEIKSSVDSYAETVVKFNLDGETVETTMGEIGFTTDEDEVIDKALAAGKTGNCLRRYKDSMELSAGIQTLELSTSPEFDDAGTANVGDVISEFNRDSVNPTIEMNSDSTFNIIPGQTGIEVDVSATVDNLVAQLKDNWSDEVTVDVVYEETQPAATEEDLSEMTDTLGTYTTSYSGAAGRMQNVENATAFINGSLIMPGEEYDVNAVMEPYTEENGYAYAAEYASGKVVQGLGGGICQVSTTLYNAVLYAELEVVERYPHSMTVGYVDLSRDAAIAGTTKNFVFKNNYDTPIYIAGGCSGGQLTFTIFGKETRPSNRTIEYESRQTSVIQPGDAVITEDSSLAAGEQVVTQSAHTGYTAELWKNIYIDGELQETVQVNSSRYNASPQYISVGTGTTTTTTTETTEATETPAETEAPTETTTEAPVEVPTEVTTEAPTEAPAPVEVPSDVDVPATQSVEEQPIEVQ